MGSYTRKSRIPAALVDGDAALASGSLEVTDEEIAAPWTSDIGDNAAARSQRKAGSTLLRDDTGIDGTGDKSNDREGDEGQLVEDHLDCRE